MHTVVKAPTHCWSPLHGCLAGLIVAKAMRTVDRSQDLGLKMLRQPTHKQMDYYYSRLLGKDWQQQLEQVG